MEYIELVQKMFDTTEKVLKESIESEKLIERELMLLDTKFKVCSTYEDSEVDREYPYAYVGRSNWYYAGIIKDDPETEKVLINKFSTAGIFYIFRTTNHISYNGECYPIPDILDDGFCFNLSLIIDIKTIEVMKFMSSVKYKEYAYMYFNTEFFRIYRNKNNAQ